MPHKPGMIVDTIATGMAEGKVLTCPDCGVFRGKNHHAECPRTGKYNPRLTVERIGLDEANEFILRHHRHHSEVVGHLFSIGAAFDGKIVGVAIVGRPVSRHRDDGITAEVTRLCTDGTRNACSFLYGATARAAFSLGFKRIGTYILASEPGVSLAAAGWRYIQDTPGRSWSVPSRPRVDTHPLQKRMLFEARNG